MAGRPWPWLPLTAILAALLAGLMPGLAAAAPDSTSAVADARGWLLRIQSAAQGSNYQGTMVFSVGGVMSSSRVGHYAVGDHVFERLEALDGRQQRILRHNDAVHTLWPQTKVAVIERRETLGAWSTTPQQVDPLALDHYELRREGAARVAGRDAEVVLLEPRDALRYAQRLWADLVTGLMLRADVMGPASAGGGVRPVLESTAFSEILIGARSEADKVLQEIRGPPRLEGYRILRPQQRRTALEAEGWALARPVSGFRLAGCVRRGMDTAGDAGDPVLQAVFTDGLTHVSVFIEPYRAQRHRGELQAQQGATGTLMSRRGDHWFTVVGDVPLPTLRLFADAVERRSP